LNWSLKSYPIKNNFQYIHYINTYIYCSIHKNQSINIRCIYFITFYKYSFFFPYLKYSYKNDLILCYCPIEQIKNSIMPFVRNRQAHSCHYCHFFLFFSISWLVVADHINPSSAICLSISAWTGSSIKLCRKCCAVHTYNYIVLTKSEREAVNTQETESFWSGKWSLSTSAKRKKSIYIGSRSLFKWSDEYGHLFPSSITDGWIITKKRKEKLNRLRMSVIQT